MIDWKRRDAFVGVFDILGFKNLIRQTDQEFPRAMLTGQLDDLLGTLDDQNVIEHGQRVAISEAAVPCQEFFSHLSSAWASQAVALFSGGASRRSAVPTRTGSTHRVGSGRACSPTP